MRFYLTTRPCPITRQTKEQKLQEQEANTLQIKWLVLYPIVFAIIALFCSKSYAETPTEVVPTIVQETVVEESVSDMDMARLERKVVCHEMYQEWKERVIRHDEIVERCATMMTIQYAFESGHWKSKRCTVDNNCFGIKNNRRARCIRSGDGFCAYSAQIEWMRDYAEMFMKHYEWYATLSAYMDVYCPDGNWAYPKFVYSKYDDILAYFTKK